MTLEELVERAGAARFALLGEATHGTHEFYSARAEITRRLIEDHGLSAVAAEADWPDAYRVNCFVWGAGDDRDAEEALREFNDALPANRPKVGFYGLDLYGLYASIAAVVEYLEDVDPDAARAARARYACFERFDEAQEYTRAVGVGGVDPCEDDVVAQLVELRRHAAEIAARDGRVEEDRAFAAEQNARVVTSADGSILPEPRIAVWAHNSHLGDARATAMARSGQLNLGQLTREAYGRDAFLVGFTTYEGTVTALIHIDRTAVVPLERVARWKRGELPETYPHAV